MSIGSQGELSNNPAWCDAPDFVCRELGEPQIAIWPIGDIHRHSPSGWQCVFSDDAASGDLADSVAITFNEPQVAVRACRDSVWR